MQKADLQTQQNDMGASTYGDRYRLALDQAKLDLDATEIGYYRASQIFNIQNAVGGEMTPGAGNAYMDALRQQIDLASANYYAQRAIYMGPNQ